jgi:thymidylate synthase
MNFILCVDQKGLCGIISNGKHRLPWKFNDDMKRFKQLTTGNLVVMGYSTYKSLPQTGLTGRINVVITEKHYEEKHPSSINFVRNIPEFLQFVAKYHQSRLEDKNFMWVIGGPTMLDAFIYRHLISRLYLTRIEKLLHTNLDENFRVEYSHIEMLNPKYMTPPANTGTLYLNLDFTIEKKDYYIWYGEDQGALVPYISSEPKKGKKGKKNKQNKVIVAFIEGTVANEEELQFLELMRRLKRTPLRPSRNISTHSMFGATLTFTIRSGILPICTVKPCFLRGIIAELLMFMRGQTNTKVLEDQKIYIWQHNTSEEFLRSRGLQRYQQGDMGPGYPWVWRYCGATYPHDGIRSDNPNLITNSPDITSRTIIPQRPPTENAHTVISPKTFKNCKTRGKINTEDTKQEITEDTGDNKQDSTNTNTNTDIDISSYEPVDQLVELINGIKTDPFSRRHILTNWIPHYIKHTALPPCHLMLQLYVHNDSQNRPVGLSGMMFQRSSDVALAGMWNVTFYCLLIHIIGFICNLEPLNFMWIVGDAHLYQNHLDGVNEMLSRSTRKFPMIILNEKIKTYKDPRSIQHDDIMILFKNCHGKINSHMPIN